MEKFDPEEFPLPFISQLSELLLELKQRVEKDIYIGLMLEVIQKVLAEHLAPFMDQFGEKVEALIIILSNLMYMQQNLLIKQERQHSGDKLLSEEEKLEIIPGVETKEETITQEEELESEILLDETLG